MSDTFVFHTELGENINRESGVVYLSKDNRKTWMTLHAFIKKVILFINKYIYITYTEI